MHKIMYKNTFIATPEACGERTEGLYEADILECKRTEGMFTEGVYGFF